MKKQQEKIMTLSEQYKNICEEYSRRFCEIAEVKGEWSGDYTIFFTEYEAYTIDDMRYVVDNIDMLKRKYPSSLAEEIRNWVDYNVDVHKLGCAYINLPSWLQGCPRISSHERQRLLDSMDAIDKVCKKLQEEFGKNEENPKTHKVF